MELLLRLMDALGPSGAELNIRSMIKKAIRPYVDEIYMDKFGNLVARQKGKGQKIMLAAHMDEIALMAKSIEDDGKIRFSPVGGMEPIALLGHMVLLMNNDGKVVCKGIVTVEALHEGFELKNSPDFDDLYVDTGLDLKELEKCGVRVGTYIIPKHHARFLGSNNIVCGKAVDDRSGCFILIEVAKSMKSVKHHDDIYYVFTMQEEVGMYGAQTSVYRIEPDFGIAIDVSDAKDALDPKKCSLGSGPCLTVMDTEMIADKCLNDTFIKISANKKIPLQLSVEDTGTTDATRIMLSKGGIPSTVIGPPVRNMHTSVTIVHMDDIKNCIRIIAEFLKNPPKICEL